jgi:hypothetical protein
MQRQTLCNFHRAIESLAADRLETVQSAWMTNRHNPTEQLLRVLAPAQSP